MPPNSVTSWNHLARREAVPADDKNEQILRAPGRDRALVVQREVVVEHADVPVNWLLEQSHAPRAPSAKPWSLSALLQRLGAAG
jgi:hypothetical protein